MLICEIDMNNKNENRKKLKEEFKRFTYPKGIFIIRNTKTGKVFIGSSLNLHNILFTNKLALNNGNHVCTQLQSDWKEYGEKCFSMEIAEELALKDDQAYNYEEDLQIAELIWIEKLRPFEQNCYNKNEKIRTV